MDADAFFSRLNPLIGWLLRSPLHVLLSSGLMLLTVTGRRTGRRYTIPVGYQRDGDQIVVMVSRARRKSWWRNYAEAAPVELVLKGRELAGRAELVTPGSEEFRQLSAKTLRRMPWLGGQFGIAYDAKAGLTDDQAKQLTDEIAIVRIAL